MKIRVAIDTGSTFTDVVAINEETGNTVAIKTPSTPKTQVKVVKWDRQNLLKNNDNLNDMKFFMEVPLQTLF